MNRRAHLKALFSAAGVAAASPWLLTACAKKPEPTAAPASASAPAAAPPEPQALAPMKFGAQLFTIRALLKENPRGTLAEMAKIGFTELELFGFGGKSTWISDPLFGIPLAEFKKLLGDLGLSVPTVHFSATEEVVDEVAAIANELGAHHLIQAMAPDFIKPGKGMPIVSGVTDKDQVLKLAESWNRIGEKCKRAGTAFAYHNHHMEFAMLGAQRAYDIMLANSDPELVRFEMDIGWAAVARVDGTEYLDKFPSRFVACHLKDFNPKLPIEAPSPTAPIPEQLQLVPPGEGSIDFTKVLASMQRNGVKHGYVEIDVPVGDPMDNVRRGYNYLSSLTRPSA
jgi:sugar phosphate isomerase/epimerase